MEDLGAVGRSLGSAVPMRMSLTVKVEGQRTNASFARTAGRSYNDENAVQSTGLYRVGVRPIPARKIISLQYAIPQLTFNPNTVIPNPFKRLVQTPPWWGARPIGTLPLPNFKIEGQVLRINEHGVEVVVPNTRVRLHYRRTGQVIASVVSDAQGRYKFVDLMPGGGDYYAVAFDQDRRALENALALDRLSTAPM